MVLAYFDVAPKYLTHHWRPPYEKDPGGRRWDKRRENVSSPTEGQASASSSSGGFPKGKGPTEQTEKGSSPKGEVPKVTVNELRRLIEEEETRNLRAAETMEMGRAIPFERGVEVEGRVDTGKVRIEKMQSAFDRLNANPSFLYEQGHLKLRNSMGRRVRTDLGDHPARCTPWASLDRALRERLGDVGPAEWWCHPLSGYSVALFLKAFDYGKRQGCYWAEMQKEHIYTRPDSHGVNVTGYESPLGLTGNLLSELNLLVSREFPDAEMVDFLCPDKDDPRARRPDANLTDYAERLEAHHAFQKEREVYQELNHVRADFEVLVDIIGELYGQDLLAYLRRHEHDRNVRERYKVRLNGPDGAVELFDCRRSGRCLPR